jgi:hypothetical protein
MIFDLACFVIILADFSRSPPIFIDYTQVHLFEEKTWIVILQDQYDKPYTYKIMEYI